MALPMQEKVTFGSFFNPWSELHHGIDNLNSQELSWERKILAVFLGVILSLGVITYPLGLYVFRKLTNSSELLRSQAEKVNTAAVPIFNPAITPSVPVPAAQHSQAQPSSEEVNTDVVTAAVPVFNQPLLASEPLAAQPLQEQPSPKITLLIEALCNNPSTLLDRKLVTKSPHPVSVSQMKDYPNIFECNCEYSQRPYRLEMESLLINHLTEKFRGVPLTICSIGSGGCFQELVIHAKLVKLGFQVNWILADRVYKTINTEEHPSITDFSRLVKLISPSSEIEVNRDDVMDLIRSIKNGVTKPANVFLAIDFEFLLGRTTITNNIIEIYPQATGQESVSFGHILQGFIESNPTLNHPRIYLRTAYGQSKCDVYGLSN